MIARLSAFLLLVVLAWAHVGAGTAEAQPRGATARALAEGSVVADRGAGVSLTLALSAAVPWRVFMLDQPERLVIDLAETALDALTPAALDRSGRVGAVRLGLFRPGWSRIVLMLDGPYRLARAGLDTGARAGGGARLRLLLEPVDSAAFAAGAGAPAEALWPRHDAAVPPPEPGLLRIALDPGHGGFDPGAERDGHSEAALMLLFAQELRETLLRSGRYDVVLTRSADVFVPLAERVRIARAAGAGVLISLHADALRAGRATGMTVYVQSEEASDAAAADLAARHDEADLLAGVDLDRAGDLVAGVLIDLARIETDPRSERLAAHLLDGVQAAGGRLYKHPLKRAGFSVLRAPDMASVLIELGFLSEPRDLENLLSPDWRAQMADGILSALDAWAQEDAIARRLMRR